MVIICHSCVWLQAKKRHIQYGKAMSNEPMVEGKQGMEGHPEVYGHMLWGGTVGNVV